MQKEEEKCEESKDTGPIPRSPQAERGGQAPSRKGGTHCGERSTGSLT